jgi:hypothetical protein
MKCGTESKNTFEGIEPMRNLLLHIRLILWLPAGLLAAESGTDCPHPATVENQLNPAMPNVIVVLRKDADLLKVADRIANAYAVQSRVLSSIHGLLLTHINEALVERLRCEPEIELLSYDIPVSIN